MGKRITKKMLVFILVLSMLATAVPAFAATIESTQLKVTADKVLASPGETITYTITMGPVSDFGTMQMDLVIPTGLTYVENSGKLASGLKECLGFDVAEYTELTKRITGAASAADFSSDTDTELATFQCTVDDDASGVLEVGLDNLEVYSCQTWEDHTSKFSVVKASITVTSAPKPATAISLNKTETTLTVGGTETLTATVTPADSTDTVEWSSSKAEVATVDSTGKVTAVAPGTATITAKAGDKTATCEVTANAAPKPATAISLNKTETTLTVGGTETLTATVTPADSTDTVEWSSSKAEVATVDSTGKITAVAPGTASITAKAGDKTATCTVTVENAPCTHTSKTSIPAKASTCEEKGWDAYSKCNDCGQLFDNAGNKIEAIPYRSLAAHSLTPFAATDATCTAAGNSAYYKCDGCGKLFEDAAGNTEITNHDSVVISALGHDYTERILDDAHKKETATDCRNHDTYWYDCSRCDSNAKNDTSASDKWYESTNAGAHDYDTTTWDYKGADGHAHMCKHDDTHDTPVGHTPGAAATETSPQTCTVCGYVITPALGHTHSMTPVAAKAATCTENGNKAYYKCDNCGKWFEDATANVEITDHSSVVLTALGHEYTEKVMNDAHKKETAADCRSHDTYWYDCSRCDSNAKNDTSASDKWYESTNAGAHDYDTTTWGYKGADGHAHKCQYDETHDVVVAHIFGTGNKCTVCGYTKSSTGGGSYRPSIQKPEITIIGSGKADLSTDGRTATIAADAGNELVSITLNGKEVAKTDKLTGLRTGDKVVITFQKKTEDPAVVAKTVATKVSQMQLIARSSKTAKKNIQVTVKGDAKTAALIKDIQDLGYTVKYKFYRSTKKSASYKAMLTKNVAKYLNTTGEEGTMYYYKARVMVYDKAGKLVAQSELKQCKYANRLWTK